MALPPTVHRTSLLPGLPRVPTPTTLKDIALIALTAILAGCGLVYQYLLSHYTGRVLGMFEHTIYLMIGLMIASMGIGAFAARKIKDPYTGFVRLELWIAFLGACALLLIGAFFVFARLAPQWFAALYGLPQDMAPQGGFFHLVENIAKIFPFIMAFILGALIGAEIPLIATVRQHLYQEKILQHNVGTVYGADYIGAGIGALIFVFTMLALPPETSAVLTAVINLICGAVFLAMFSKRIQRLWFFSAVHVVLVFVLIWLYSYAADINRHFEDMLYKDRIIHSSRSEHQHITITQRLLSENDTEYRMFLNGRSQFSTTDEKIYHNMLIYPAMLAAEKHDRILIVGGGDGMALRDALKAGAEHVTLLELDPHIVNLFTLQGPTTGDGFAELNDFAFSDPRVRIIYGNAYHTADRLIQDRLRYDVIIVDLPDPSHPDLNLLYSAPFYRKLHLLTADNGIVNVQSTSPFHAKDAFLTVGVTMRKAGFRHVERYRQNVPSFGEWGWTIAGKSQASPRERMRESSRNIPQDSWGDKSLMDAAFIFPRGFFDGEQQLAANLPGTHLMYLLHRDAWRRQ